MAYRNHQIIPQITALVFARRDRRIWRASLRLFLAFALIVTGGCAFAQAGNSQPAQPPAAEITQPLSHDLPAAPNSDVQNVPAAQVAEAAEPSELIDAPGPKFIESVIPIEKAIPEVKRQTKRIFGIMPNYRSVSAGDDPPPPSPKQAFMIATKSSFDYSNFVFSGLSSMLSEARDSHPELGKGVGGFGQYYWRGMVDKTDGNYLVLFALPTVFHEDERYYTKGKGGIFKRSLYAASRVVITPDYNGNQTINASELLGRGMAQGIALSYYPSADATVSSVLTHYALSLTRDALTNALREFWPDIANHLARHKHLEAFK
jgi:hypothetical protein